MIKEKEMLILNRLIFIETESHYNLQTMVHFCLEVAQYIGIYQ